MQFSFPVKIVAHCACAPIKSMKLHDRSLVNVDLLAGDHLRVRTYVNNSSKFNR